MDQLRRMMMLYIAEGMEASECEEKWRNFCSTLAKNLKPKPSGSGATRKKPYYLTDAMQFAIPFINVAGTSSGNLPAIPEQMVASDEETLDDTQQFDVSNSEITTEPAYPSVAATTGRKRKRHDSQCDLDKELVTYFRAKTAEITKKASPNENSLRREGIQSFLNSLIPDLLPMTDAELRVFKRKSLMLVDEVLDARVMDHHTTPSQEAARE